jgi:hypothetical protein
LFDFFHFLFIAVFARCGCFSFLLFGGSSSDSLGSSCLFCGLGNARKLAQKCKEKKQGRKVRVITEEGVHGKEFSHI